MLTNFFTASVAALSLLSAASAQDLSAVSIRGVTHGGQACPQGSTDFSISADKYSITTRYTAFSMSLTSGSFSRKNCQINLDIQYPSGLQYAIVDTTFKDTANIQGGTGARHSVLYYFSGNAEQNTCAKYYSGPMSGDFTYKETISSPVWSPCGSRLPLNINNAVVLSSHGDGDAYFNSKVTVSGLIWRDC
ncbi:hypothetical protein BJ875DRAFT_544306 [Amylocarpus encephaloides]|uniref:Secreted protein n=1 Tax=Amylocarpus encephaloides TaxID=45428 RepID=A0A9P7YGR6_9HELO|nr:hypothetical protein BJ875DRAFT_544306 [Amylocarpus encephaloides]